MTSYDHTATSSLLLLVNSVLDPQASSLNCVVKNRRIFVISYTSKEDDRVGRENILGTSSGVLSSPAGNELRRVVVQEIFVDAQVFLLSQDRVVRLESIFCEESIVSFGLDIYEGATIRTGQDIINR